MMRWLLEDFAKANLRLEEALALPADSDVVKAGCIQYFEFCFELAWKASKAALEEHGLIDCASPKSCLRQAFAQGWINDETIWLEMLEARNRMSHTYDAARALEIFQALPRFLPALKGLQECLESLQS
ncbi:MAG: nucleotidyltransferase substrate binding protein [Rhodocyclaceae bacterium]|nr:nucleotidyltransferase substrate binding protein [Rhodocyclaceae bacterium]